jgi:predicted anti-sigma-YlaC factor YlaD
MNTKSHPRGALCERSRTWAALAPDGELSELERRLLAAHLAHCPACAEFSVEVAAIAAELRAAALQPLPLPVSVPVWRRRPAYMRVRAVGSAAAVALMALGIAARAPLSPGDEGTFGPARVTNFANNADREMMLIIRRSDNEIIAKTRFRPNREGIATRPI